MKTVGTVLKDACLIGILADALMPGKDSPLWPITWDQLAPLQNLEVSHNHQGSSEHTKIGDAQYHRERLLLLLSMLVTARNYETGTFVPPSWLTVHPLTYNVCPAELMQKPKNTEAMGAGILGYVLYHAACHRAYVVFSGTANGCMSMIDMDYVQVPYSELTNYRTEVGGHRGFYQAYLSIRPQILEALQGYQKEGNLSELVICGHSLGGGMATVAAFDLAGLSPIHYSFAGPRVFNVAGAKAFDEIVSQRSVRVTNDSDIVPTMPMAVMPNGNSFNHVGQLHHFKYNMGNYSDNHSLAYLLHYQLVAVAKQ